MLFRSTLKGCNYYYPDENTRIAGSKAKALEFLRDNPTIYAEIESRARESIRNKSNMKASEPIQVAQPTVQPKVEEINE